MEKGHTFAPRCLYDVFAFSWEQTLISFPLLPKSKLSRGKASVEEGSMYPVVYRLTAL